MAPQDAEKTHFAPEEGATPVSEGPRDEAQAERPPLTSHMETPPQITETSDVPADSYIQVGASFDGVGGVRRVRVRPLLNGLAVC